MKKEPMVSVIVPVYNQRSEYLDKCIHSLLKQTFDCLEIIIVDDGSDEIVSKQIDSYNNEKIIIIHQDNSGQASARNKGIECARGTYIVFVDSDDYCSSEMIQVAYACAKKTNADIVCWGCKRVIQEKVYRLEYNLKNNILIKDKDIWKISCMMLHESSLDEIYFPFSMCVWGKLFKKSLLNGENEHRFFHGLVSGEDQLFMQQILQNVKLIVFLKKDMYFYRVNEESITRSYRPNIFNEMIALFDKLELILSLNNKKVQHAFDVYRAGSLIDINNKYIWHPMNRNTISEKKIYLKGILRNRHFCEAVKKISIYDFKISTFIFILALRFNMYRLSLLLGWIGSRRRNYDRYNRA